MPVIPKNERRSLTLLARLSEGQASELSRALSTASAELDRNELAEHIVNDAPSVKPEVVGEILKTVRQIAAVKEIFEEPAHVFFEDIAEEMGEIEEIEFRLDETEQSQLRDRLTKLSATAAIEFHAKGCSLQQDRENAYCRARIITDLRPVFGSDVRQSPKAVLVAHTLRITYHHGPRSELRDLFLSVRDKDLDQLGELIERARLKAESLHAFAAAVDLQTIE